MKKSLILVTALAATALWGCQPSGSNSQAPSTETTAAATEATTEATTEAKKTVNLIEVADAVKKAYGDKYIPSMEYDEQAMKDVFGIDKGLYEFYIAEGPMISVHVDTFIAVQALPGKGPEIERILNEYRDAQINDSLQYPMNQAKVQASSVVRYDDYVFFVMLGSPSDEAEMKGEEEALKSAQENNKIGMDVIAGFFQ